MGDHLRADLNRIKASAKTLRTLAGELGNATRTVSEYAGFTGSPQVTGALESFMSDWAVHREFLVRELTRQAGLADAAFWDYAEVDKGLAGLAALLNQVPNTAPAIPDVVNPQWVDATLAADLRRQLSQGEG